MRKLITRKLWMLLIACMGAVAMQAQANYFEGWNSAAASTPGDAGWLRTDGASWNAVGGNDAYRNSIYTVSTKCIVTDYKNPNAGEEPVYAYPVTLPGSKFYSFSGQFGAVNGDDNRGRNFLIDFNSSSNKKGNSLIATSYTCNAQTSANNVSFSFCVPEGGVYYFTYVSEQKGNNGTRTCRGIIGELSLTELGNALTITFNTDNGSDVASQYVLEGASEKATKPADPTKTGYIFGGWYTDDTFETEYNFDQAVATDITIYAKWMDIKEGLKAQITIAGGLLSGGTATGTAYLQAQINAAQTIVDNNDASVAEVEASLTALTAAIAVYQDASLSSLSVDATAITGFSATTYQYNYSLAPAANVPVVAATGAAAADIVIIQAEDISGMATVTVTAGNGTTKEYTIDFSVSYMAGWDGDDSKTTPDAAGWLSPDAITWNALNTSAGRNCYRDGLATGGSVRALVGNANNKYAYPLTGLTVGKVYHFKGSYKWISNGNVGDDRRWTFGINTAIDGASETMLNSVSGTGGGLATAEFSFVYTEQETLYLVWNGNKAAYAIDNLFLYETGDALVEATVTSATLNTFLNTTLCLVQKLTLEGDFTAANITTLAAKLGTNKVLTTVDLTNATVADGATDIFAALNPNAIKLFAAGASVPTDWTNAVVGGTAANLAFTDLYPFDNTQAFTATTMTYKREFAAGWSTFCLPFGMDAISGINGTIERFGEVKATTISFVADVTAIQAGVAYLINKETAGWETFSGSNVNFPLTDPANANAFKATYDLLTGTNAEGKLILVEDTENGGEIFLPATDEAVIPAFRGYISLSSSGPTRTFVVEHDKATGLEEGDNDIAALTVTTAKNTILIAAGVAQQVTITAIDGSVVKTLALAAGESDTIGNLAAGIYLVNNRKVAVR